MATTAQKVFDIAMGLIDEVDENSGSTNTSDTLEYKQRTLLILNALRGELYPYSDTYSVIAAGTRPICTAITALTDVLDLDDFLAQSVLPYGLAAQLLVDENPSSASFLQQRYAELTQKASKIPVESEDITDVYGVASTYNEFGSW